MIYTREDFKNDNDWNAVTDLLQAKISLDFYDVDEGKIYMNVPQTKVSLGLQDYVEGAILMGALNTVQSNTVINIFARYFPTQFEAFRNFHRKRGVWLKPTSETKEDEHAKQKEFILNLTVRPGMDDVRKMTNEDLVNERRFAACQGALTMLLDLARMNPFDVEKVHTAIKHLQGELVDGCGFTQAEAKDFIADIVDTYNNNVEQYLSNQNAL